MYKKTAVNGSPNVFAERHGLTFGIGVKQRANTVFGRTCWGHSCCIADKKCNSCAMQIKLATGIRLVFLNLGHSNRGGWETASQFSPSGMKKPRMFNARKATDAAMAKGVGKTRTSVATVHNIKIHLGMVHIVSWLIT